MPTRMRGDARFIVVVDVRSFISNDMPTSAPMTRNSRGLKHLINKCVIKFPSKEHSLFIDHSSCRCRRNPYIESIENNNCAPSKEAGSVRRAAVPASDARDAHCEIDDIENSSPPDIRTSDNAAPPNTLNHRLRPRKSPRRRPRQTRGHKLDLSQSPRRRNVRPSSPFPTLSL